MSKAKRAYEKGKTLEKRVAGWLSRVFGYDCKMGIRARGKTGALYHDVDILAFKKKRSLKLRRGTISLFRGYVAWVECKAVKVKHRHITKLAEAARNVRDAFDAGIEKWYPFALLVASDVGFDPDAIEWANKYSIYCVEVGDRRYEFMGRMTREDFENNKESEY